MTVENKIETVLYLGGCRSGKSRLAEAYCRSLYKVRIYVATMTITGDEEMNHRIELHKSQRGDQWQLVEEPYELGAVLQTAKPGGVVLVDCLTMWLTNLLLADRTDAEIENEVEELCKILAKPSCSIVLVANEVGLGIVPESALARRFRDLAGWTNQQVAATCKQVYFVAGGLPMVLKGGDA